MDILKPEVGRAIEEGALGIGNGSTECEGGSTRESAIAIRMWKGGPLRQMAATKVSAVFIPYAKTINGCHFAGRYVCDGCQQPCGGISLSDVGKMSGNRPRGWLCDSCKAGKTRQPRQTRTQEQRQAAIQRLAAARRNRATVLIQSEEMPETGNAAVAAEANPNKEVYGIM